MGDKIGATTEEKRTTQQNHIHTQEINKPNPVKRKKEKVKRKNKKRHAQPQEPNPQPTEAREDGVRELHILGKREGLIVPAIDGIRCCDYWAASLGKKINTMQIKIENK